MFVDNEKQIVFVAIPKTGTRSVYKWMRQNGGHRLREHQIRIPNLLVEYTSFTTVRNPYSRIVSGYRCHNQKQILSIDEWLKTRKFRRVVHSRPQAPYAKRNRIDYVLRFETLAEDFEALPFSDRPLEFENVTSTKDGFGGHFTDLMTNQTVHKINEIYAKDFHATGYRMATGLQHLKEMELNV